MARAFDGPRNLAGVPAGEVGFAGGGQLQCDVRAGVARADHQDGARCEVRWVLVAFRRELLDLRAELLCECRHLGLPVPARGDHHVAGLDALVVRFDDEALSVVTEAGDPDIVPHRQREAVRVAAEVVGELFP